MGGLCSKNQIESNLGTWTPPQKNQSQKDEKLLQQKQQEVHQKQQQEPEDQKKKHIPFTDDEFYDGIPRYSGDPQRLSQKSRSVRSKQAAVAKVSEVSSRLGRAGIEVLDTLGSSMTSLNTSSGFASGAVTKGNEISILAFEVANTIVKGSNLMQSLSKRSIKSLKEHVLPSEGVQHLVSKDMDELLLIVAADKREELKIFSGEVVRFGSSSKDPQWHNLDRYFEKISREPTPQRQLKEEADLVMQQLMTLVQFTAELYHELNALDRFEQDYQRKCLEDSISRQRGDNLAIMRSELKSQKKLVKTLKKKSLWSRSLEEVMGKLVDVVQFLHLEIHNVFGREDGDKPAGGPLTNNQRLGPAGLSLHYANIVIQIDTLVARSSSVPPNTRDTLYQSLPPSIISALRSKMHTFHVKQELTISDIKDEMEKTLHWLVPVATNTAKAHHGFGWVGEWANTGSEANRKPTIQNDVIRIETLHHADREKTEACLLELLLWLHHLISLSKSGTNGAAVKSSIKPSMGTPTTSNQQPKKDLRTNGQSLALTVEDQEQLERASRKKGTPCISKSQYFDAGNTNLKRNNRLSKSCNNSPKRTKESLPCDRLSSGLHIIDFGIDKEKALDATDRVQTIR